MNFKQWLSKSFAPRVHSARASRRDKSRQRSRPRHTPRLESLEDRLAPAILTVTNTNANGVGSLANEIIASTSLIPDGQGVTGTGNDTIRFASALDGATINVNAGGSVAGSGLAVLPRAELTPTLTIDGLTGLTKGITISGAGTSRLFINQGANLTLIGLTLASGDARGFAGGNASDGGAGGGSAGMGGAILNYGNGEVTLQDCTLTGNTAQGGAGGSFQYISRAFGGGGGGGLGAAGSPESGNFGGAGGGIAGHGGVGGTSSSPGGGHGAFGGGGGGAFSNGSGYNSGGAGGFGGGGGGAGPYFGNGGAGGFGGGGGGAASDASQANAGLGGYGGGNGAKATEASGDGGGGGAGMGGAIFNEGGTVIITNCTFTNNTAVGGAGGTHAFGGKGLGGAVFNHNGTLTVINSTFSGNLATTTNGAGSIFNLGDSSYSHYGVVTATATITNTILVQSSVPAAFDIVNNTNGSGTLNITGTNNLICDGSNNLAGIQGQIGTPNSPINPLLAPLGSYGGTTKTMTPLPGSPAIDAGANTTLAPYSLTTDERGFSRLVNSNVDIGAVESRGFQVSSSSGSGQSVAVHANFNPLTETISSSSGEPVAGGQVTFTAPALTTPPPNNIPAASATLNQSTTAITATISIGSDGTVSMPATADGIPGNYPVSASASGVTPSTFRLSNTNKTSFSNLSTNTGQFSVPYGTPSIRFNGTVIGSSDKGTNTPTGSVSVTLNGVTQNGSLGNGTFTTPAFNIASLPVGSYSLAYAYSGDPKDAPSVTSNTLTVTAAQTTLAISASPTTYGASASITVTVSSATGTPTGNVELTGVAGSITAFDLTQALVKGSTTYTIPGLNAGNYSLSATFTDPQGNFASPTTGNNTLTVVQASPTFTNLTSPSITVGAPTTTIKGTIGAGTVYPTGASVSVTLNEINAPSLKSATGGSLGSGTHYYVLTAQTPQGTLTSPETSIVISSGTNNKVTLSWNAVTGATGYQIYSGSSGNEMLLTTLIGSTTSFTDDGSITPSGALTTPATQTDAVVSNGNFTATFNTANLPPGVYPITYNFLGNTDFQPVSFTGDANTPPDANTSAVTVNQIHTTTSISAPTITFGAAASIKITVTPDSGSVTGTFVDLSVNGTDEKTQPLVNGTAIYTIPGLSVGPPYNLLATYTSQGNFAGSSATGQLTVAQVVPIFSNLSSANIAVDTPTLTLTGNLAMPNGSNTTLPANSSVTVTFGGLTPTNARVPVNSDGSFSAMFNTASLPLGTYPVTYSYGGSPNFQAVTDTSTVVTVGQAPTTTSISAPTITSDISGNITVTVSSAAGTPTGGNVDLMLDGVDQGQQPLTGGIATFTVGPLSIGNHSLTASYLGQGNFQPSDAPAGTNLTVISPLTFSALTSQPNPAPFGTAKITLKGNISSGTVYPTGSTVTITLGGLPPVNATVLSDGSFSGPFSTASLGVGTYPVTYKFAGNANFGAVTDKSTAVTVQQVVPTFSALSSPTIVEGAATTPLSGHIGSGTAVPAGSIVSITFGGLTPTNAPVQVQPDGSFRATFDTSSLAVGNYTATYSFAGDTNFLAATPDTSTKVTVISNDGGLQPIKFDFGGAGQAATLKLDSSSGTPTLEFLRGGSVVDSRALADTLSISFIEEGNDSLTLDFTTPFSVPMDFDYSVAGNALSIIGGDVLNTATYTPTANVGGAGQLQLSSSDGTVSNTIPLSGLSALAVSNLASFTLITPADDNNITIGSPSTGVNSISGTSGGTAFVPVTFSNVADVTIDTSVKDSPTSVDTVTILSSGLVASGLQNFTLKTDNGNSMLLVYAQNFSLPVSGGTFAFEGTIDGANTLVGPSPSTNPNLVLTNVSQSIPVPVIVLPGFTGSFATAAATKAWFSTIGMSPSDLLVDPLENTYGDLIGTLKKDGYVSNPAPGQAQTLFEAPWDWRLPLAPQNDNEAIDGGMLDNLTATKLTGDGYQYAVDYLGTALVTAAQSWASVFNGRSLPAVNVITHSTGGVIARAYVQSPSYGATLSAGATLSGGATLSSSLTLPKINDAVMMASPNQGSVEAFDAANNNLGDGLLDRVWSLLVQASYDAVVTGNTITSPNGNITLSSIMVNSSPSIQKFLTLYCSALFDLTPTFSFLTVSSGTTPITPNGIPNNLLLELNDGLGAANPPANSDPNSFLDSPTNSILGTLYNEFSTMQNMEAGVLEEGPDPAGSIVPLGDFFAQAPTTTWFKPVFGTDNGDGTLSVTSTIGQYLNPDGTLIQSLATKVVNDQVGVSHSDIPSDPTSLENMLSDLGQNDSSSVIDKSDSGFDLGTTLERYLTALVPSNSGASLSWHGLTFDVSNINATYDSAHDIFTLTGQSSVTVAGLGTIGIQLGGLLPDGTQTGGLVMNGDNFTSLDATISGNLSVGGVTLHSDGLELIYTNGEYEIQGAADFSLDGSTVNVTLGDGMNSGLVVQNGTLTSLDMTVDSNITIGALTFTTTGLNFTYDAGASTFTMTGTAGLTLSNASNFSVNFGGTLSDGTQTPGLVITNGNLTSLAASISSNFEIDGVTFDTNGLGFSYSQLNKEYTVSGQAGVEISGMDSLTVTFGHGLNSGLDIVNGALTSLDMTVDSNITIDSVAFQTTGLEFIYTDTDGTEVFNLKGAAALSVGSIANLSVSFVNQGLVITDGVLTNLDMTVDSDISVDNVTLKTTGLEFTYTSSDGSEVFSLVGEAAVTVGGFASLDVNFVGQGLVISDGNLTNLDMSITSSFVVDNVTFSTDGLTFLYVATYSPTGTLQSQSFQLTGEADLTVGHIADLSVDFVNQGLVINNGELTSLNMSITSSFSVDNVMFSTDGLTFLYAATYTPTGAIQSQSFQLTGEADLAVGHVADLSVDFVGPGLVISGGQLTNLDMSVTSNFTISSVTFGTQGLTFNWSSGNGDESFQLTGSAYVTVGGIENASGGDRVAIIFANNGLVIDNGSLVQLDVAVNSHFKVGSVEFGTDNLEFIYTAADGKPETFQMLGTAFVIVGGINGVGGNQVSVTFANNGLLISDGELDNLDVSVTSSFKVGSVVFGTDKLEFAYAATYSQGVLVSYTFQLTGTAFLKVGGIQGVNGDSVSVDFANDGLIINNGQLQSLDVAVSSDFKVGSVRFGLDNLEFRYTASPETFQLLGSAFLDVGGIGGSGVGGQQVKITFGDNDLGPGADPNLAAAAANGLLIRNGNLVSLDVSLNGSFTVGRVNFGAKDLNFLYVAATDTFQMTGTAFVALSFKGLPTTAEVDVIFANNGLLISNGNLVSLDVAVQGTFPVGLVTFGTKNLEFSYVVATNTFQMLGSAYLEMGGMTLPGQTNDQITVTFANNGLLITDGVVQSVDVSINSDFQVGSVTVNIQNLEFIYDGDTGTFDMQGSAGISAVQGLAQLNVDFGYTTPTGTVVPGLVIDTNSGDLVSLNMLVTSTIGIGSIGFNGNLVLTYTESNHTFIMTGTASVNLPDVGSINVNLGGTNPDGTQTQGLVVQNGVVTNFDMTVTTSGFSFHGLSFSITDFVIHYASQGGQSLFTMTGDASVNLPSVGNASVDFGGPGTQGIVVTNGALTAFNMTVDVNFSLAGINVFGDLAVSYQSSTANFIMTGNANANFLGTGFVVQLGGNGTQGLVIHNGKLTSFDMTLTGTVGITNVFTVSVSTTVTYNASLGEFTLSGTGDISLQVPSFLQFAMGNTLHLFSIGYSIVDISNDNADSYVQFSTTVLNVSVGIKVNFNGAISLDPGVDVLQSIENGLKKAADAIASGWSTFVSWFGPLAGATVYYDANDNFDFAHDPSAVTASNGTFQLAIPPGSTTGQIVVVGGVDQSTGLANAAILTAPLGATTITPFTTLVNDIEQQTGVSQSSAIADVQQALGLPTGINPLAGDYIKQALAGDPNAARMFATEVQLTALSYQIDSLISVAGGGTAASVSTHFFNTLASTIAGSTGAPLNLLNPATLQGLINTTAASVNVNLDPTIAAGAAAIVAGVNQYIAALPVSGSAAYLNQVVQAQVVAEKTIAPLLAQAVTGSVSINTVVAEETGTALASQIAVATIGSVNLDGPTLLIANQVRQPVGNGDPSTMQFSVYLATKAPLTQPVTVHFTTVDNTATAANGDYTPLNGTLTWLPGDTAPKTITVAVNPTSQIAADKLFTIVLSQPINASIESAVGVGDIEFTDIATTTNLIISTTNPSFGDQVTLTATVINQDAALDAGTGSVTFSDGTTVLGSATLVNGVATLMTTALNSGTHAISASYAGLLAVGERFDASNAAPVSVTVAPATQTVDFEAPAEQTYGVAPILLDATSSSGLPVAFKVLSGPAFLVGRNLLTITGAGTVSIEADQAGDSDNQAAPSVVQMLQVDPATLTFAADNQVMTYGGTLPTLTGRFISGFVNGDGLGSVLTQPTLSTVGANSHVGSYAIVASGAAAANYAIIYLPGTLSITPASLTIAPDHQSMVQGSELPVLTASYSGLVNGDTPTALTTLPTLSTTATSASPIGFYPITASGTVDPDYTISYVADTLNVAIEAPTIALDTSATAIEYGQSVTFTASVSGDQGTAIGFVQFQADGVNIGPLQELSDGIASLTTADLTAGSRAITAVFRSSNDNYTDGSSQLSESVTPANATFQITPYSVTYDGNAHTAIGTATGVDGEDLSADLTLNGTTHTNAGNYAIDTWFFHDPNGNYQDASGTVNDMIGQATATITINPFSVTYDGNTHTATGTAFGVQGEDLSADFTLTGTTHTNAGSYTDTWTFQDPNGNYKDASGTVNDMIGQAKATVVVTGYMGGTYDGNSHTQAVTVTGVPADGQLFTTSLTGLNAGNFSQGWSFSSNPNYAAVNGILSFTIGKANATLMVTPYHVTYDGNAHTATYSLTGVDGETGAAVGIVTLNTTHTNAGTYASDSWSFSPSLDYNNITGTTITDTIAKANASIAVTSYGVTYDGMAHTPTGSATGVGGVNLASGLNFSGTHTNAGSYSDSWSFSGGTNYNDVASTTITDVITKAKVTYTIDNATQVYGSPADLTHGLPATIATGVNGETLGIAYASTGDSSTAHVGAFPISGALTNGSGALSNYAVTLNNGTLTVNPFAFTYQIGNDTQLAGNPANLANDLGTTIPTGINGQTLAITYASTGDNAAAAPGAYPITATLANGTGLTSDYKVTLQSGILTVTSLVNEILLLDPSASDALQMSGNSVINESSWPVYVNSKSASAIQLSGNASLTASKILDVGGYQKSGNAVFHPTPLTGSAATSDPLASLQAPSAGSSQGAINLSGNSTQTIQPGTYTQFVVSGNANLTMAPGVYVVTSGGFSASGNAKIKGSGVVIYIAAGSINLSGNSTALLTAPTSGAYNGVSIFQARSDTSAINLSGNTYLSSGTLYAPKAALNLSGNSNVSAPLIVDQLALSGNADPSPNPPSQQSAGQISMPMDLLALIGGSAQGSLPSTFANASTEVRKDLPKSVQGALDEIMANLSTDAASNFGEELLELSTQAHDSSLVFAAIEDALGGQEVSDWSN